MTTANGRVNVSALLSYKTPKEVNKLAHFLSDVMKEATAKLQVENGVAAKRKAASKSNAPKESKATKAASNRKSDGGSADTK